MAACALAWVPPAFALPGAAPNAGVAAGETAARSPGAEPAVARAGDGPSPAAARDTGEVAGATAPPEVAIYPDGLALVRESLAVRPDPGGEPGSDAEWLAWDDAPSSLDPTSLWLELDGGARVAERVFLPRVGGSTALLRSAIGEEVALTRSDGEVLRGTLRDVRDGVVLETPEGGTLLLSPGEVRLWRLEGVPAAFRPSPRVLWRVAGDDRARAAELSYLAGGLSWSGEYLLHLSADERRADLEGWADLSNGTDRSWEGATVKLVAGEISRARGGEGARARGEMLLAAARAAPAADRAEAEARDFAELKVFELPRAADLVAGQSRQVRLLSAGDVPVRKLYETVGGARGRYGHTPSTRAEIGTEPERTHVRAFLRFTTGEDEGIDQPLPRGRVRVYEKDEDGAELLAGEDRVGDVPVGDTVQVELGEVFDLTRERTRTDFTRPDPRTMEESFRITLRNAREEPVDVRVVEHLFRWQQWEVVSAAVDGEPSEPVKLDARRVLWTLPVPAGGSATLTYRVRYRWE